MNAKDINQAKDPLLPASMAALKRAAQIARQTAMQTNTAIVLVQAGGIVRISAEALRKEAETSQQVSQPIPPRNPDEEHS